jgi:hypothetical protein
VEGNRQSLISRPACALLAAAPFVPIIEYLGGLEPTRRSLAYLTILTFRQEPIRWLMLLWMLPAVLAVLRLSNALYKAHVALAAVSAATAITEVLIAASGTDNLTIAQLQVYTGLQGVCPSHHYGLHGALVGGLSAIWMLDELWAKREFKSADGI